jgi:GlpG protein
LLCQNQIIVFIPRHKANAAPAYTDYKPVVTIVCSLACLVLFAGINITGPNTQEAYTRWGAPSFAEVFSDSYWGLITNNFLHVQWWHILFNLSWFWPFGKKIEHHNHKLFYAFLLASAAIVTSTAQLIFSGATGIGLSGIVYAMFGFLLVRGRYDDAYRAFLSRNTTILFLVWLFACIALTRLGILTVGNAGHFGGMLWGIFLGFLSGFKPKVWLPSGLVVVALMIAFTFFSKYSLAGLSFEAYQYHKDQQIDKAIAAYQKILDRDPTTEFGKQNLQQLKIYKLSIAESESEAQNRFDDARQRCNEILQLDKDNEWAKSALGRLPAPE